MQAAKDRGAIGFIGTGVMGKSMAGHFLKAGSPVQVYSRTPSKAQSLLDQGATWADSPAVVARTGDVIFTMVGFPQDVEALYFGPNGLLANLKAGTILVDMTTSRPDLAKRIWQEALACGGQALDAPVSGGDKGAREATLSIMVGGEEGTFAQVLPLFELMGRNIILQGPAGSWTLANLGPRMLAGDYAPGFYIKHFIKDMRIARESAQALGMDTPGLDTALSLYQRLSEQGEANSGTQALIKHYL